MQVEHGRVAQHPRDSGARFLQQSPSPVRNCWRGATIFLTTQKPALCTISTDQNNPTMMASQSWHHNARPVLKSPSTLHSASLKHGATVRIRLERRRDQFKKAPPSYQAAADGNRCPGDGFVFGPGAAAAVAGLLGRQYATSCETFAVGRMHSHERPHSA